MEKHPEQLALQGLQRASGDATPFNAGDAIACTIDVCREMGFPVAPSIKARLGKGSKGLIEAGFTPDVVVAACVVAIRTGWFGSVETIAQEMVVASQGGRMARSEYQRALAETSTKISKADSPVWQAMRSEMARLGERKEIR